MPTVHRINRSFQVTIPVEIRKKLNLRVGDYIGFELREDGILIKPKEVVDRMTDQEAIEKIKKVKSSIPTVAHESVEEYIRNVCAYVRRTEPWQEVPDDPSPAEFVEFMRRIGVDAFA